jgi:hypothetical protein
VLYPPEPISLMNFSLLNSMKFFSLVSFIRKKGIFLLVHFEMNFEKLFTELEIEMKDCPFKLKPVPKPTKEEIKNTENRLKFEFSEDFKEFHKQIGPGNLGRVKLFGITNELNGQNLIYACHRLGKIFEQQKMIHSFPMHELIIFGQDMEHHSIYYGWKREGDLIYSLGKSTSL